MYSLILVCKWWLWTANTNQTFDKTTRPTLIAYGYNIGCTHIINYKREPFVAHHPISMKIVQIFNCG